MGVLYKTVEVSQELKRQHMIQQLIALGITEEGGRPVQDLDYFEVRHLLTMAKIKSE
ncbi:hypothetical protein NST81_01780 [Bacillus sp. FSL W8-0223]|jgi:hypothetical protein|uniref:hypothetical protein n=1 Tax=Bacillus sp. FSL W8-0223 TaxID=2954595 RepID=UPI0030F94EC3